MMVQYKLPLIEKILKLFSCYNSRDVFWTFVQK